MKNNFWFKPQNLSEFIGNEDVIKTIKIGIKVFKKTNKQLDHILFYGAPGVGKTSLALLIAKEMGVNIKIVQGSHIQTISDILGILSSLRPKDILFIDEIHALKQEIAESLYPALEEKVIDLIIGKSFQKKTIRINIPDFTLIAATTNLGNIHKALEERFGYVFFINSYTSEELKKIIKKAIEKIKINIKEEEIEKIVEASRGIPRNAIRILKRLYDYSLASETIDIQKIISECGFICKGLRFIDIQYLKLLNENEFLSLNSISHKLNLDEKTIINKIEPFLHSNDLIIKSSRGRKLNNKGKELIKEI